MKKVFLIIFAFIIMGLFNNTVLATDEWGGDAGGDGSSGGYSNGCKGANSCWNDSAWGFRISLIDKDGNRIKTPDGKVTNSANYLNSKFTGKVYSVRANPNRFEILNGTIKDNFELGLMNPIPATTAVKDYYNTGNANIIVDYFNDILNKAVNESIEVIFLQSMGLDKAEVIKECKQGMLLLVEPLFVIKGGGNTYIGTGTEIARLMYRLDPNFSHAQSISYKGTIPKAIMTPNNTFKIKNLIPVSTFTNGKTGPDIQKLLYKSGTSIYGYAMGVWDYSKTLDCTPPGGGGGGGGGDDIPDVDIPDLCTFDLDVDIKNDCDEGTTSHIDDIYNWPCIFESRNASEAKIKNHFYEWENRYCSVFCRESITYDFPDGDMNVFAGRRFTVGYTGFSPTLSPVAFTGRSECRITSTTGSIRWDLFKKDWADANIQVKNTWDAYQIEVKKDDGIAAYIQSPSKNCANYCDNNVHGIECCKSAKYVDPVKCSPGAINCTPKSGYWKCTSSDTPYDHGYTRTPSEQTYINTDNVTLKINTSSWCTSCGNSFSPTKCTPDTTDTANKRSLYQSALATRDGYLKNLKECNNFQRTYNDFKPVTFFEYEEERYGGETYQLEDNLEVRAQTNYFSGGATLNGEHKWNTSSYVGNSNEFVYSYDNFGKTNVIAKWVCDTLRLKCHSVNEPYPINDWVKSFTTKQFDYVLPENIYRFIDKPSGESYHYSPGPNSYDIGFSNLPVHYSRAPGVYDFSIDYKTFGPNHKFNKYIFDGEYIGISYGQDLGIYSYMWNKPAINAQIRHCDASGNHLGHSFVNVMGTRLDEFIASGCSETYGCYKVGGQVKCQYYFDTNGVKKKVSSVSFHPTTYTAYNQLRACIQSKVVSTTGSIAFNEDTKYECQYKVQNRVMCEPEKCYEQIGLSAIYREINLSDPFPGLNGTGRTPGNNWNLPYYISDYITNNRGVKTDSVYFERDPMYKITLTPEVIKSIRAYNKKQAQYEDGYADFKMSCLENGTKCLSGFIRESEFKKLFTGCGIIGKAIGDKSCVKDEAW